MHLAAAPHRQRFPSGLHAWGPVQPQLKVRFSGGPKKVSSHQSEDIAMHQTGHQLENVCKESGPASACVHGQIQQLLTKQSLFHVMHSCCKQCKLVMQSTLV